MSAIDSRRILRVVTSILLTIAVVWISRTIPHVTRSTTALSLIVVILGIATRWGTAEAIAAAVASAAAFNYFMGRIAPAITPVQEVLDLSVFLATAITTSQLALRARRRAAEAMARRNEMERLHAFGQAILESSTLASTLQNISGSLVRAFGFEAAALFHLESGEVFGSGASASPISSQELRRAAAMNEPSMNPATNLRLVPVLAGGRAIGSLGIVGHVSSEQLLKEIADRVAMGLVRVQALEEGAKATAARKSDELRSAVVDALAHDLKTPLTSIKAAITSLLSGESEIPPEQRELLTIVDEETDRLDGLVSQALEMARLDAGVVRLERRREQVSDLIRSALEDLRRPLQGRPLQVDLPEGLPPVDVDFHLMTQAIKQLLGNALKYSPPGSRLLISSAWSHDEVTIKVRDSGPGIPEQEQARIFEKYYRANGRIREVPGNGLGLAIAKSIIEVHGGRIGVSSAPGQGSVFYVTLPVIQLPRLNPQYEYSDHSSRR